VALSIPIVWTDAHREHDPERVVWVGVPIPADEVPARAEAIREALTAAGASLVAAEPHPDDPLLAVHDPGLVEFLRGAWEAWNDAGFPEEPGQPDVVGYVFPTPGLLAGLEPREPASLAARTGLHCFDTMTPVGPGTWTAARAAVDAALTAADLVLAGERAAYASCRPPGHHATRSAFGGSCYLNSAAVAARYLREHGSSRVALIDVDAHHGNGAQAIFREDQSVLTASLHVDPAAGWFPHFLGFAEESDGANVNVTLAPGTGDREWLSQLERLLAAARVHRSEALVVALGVDGAAEDPNSPLEVTAEGFREAGGRLGALGLPTVLVQEGGYVPETVGALVRAVLEGFDRA